MNKAATTNGDHFPGAITAKDAVVATAASTIPRLSAAAPLPPGHERPQVTYYQTLDKLELKVELPDDNIRYAAMLQDNTVIIFRTLEHKPVLRFAVNTQHNYIDIRHHMMGRTVYISAFKKWVIPYPLKSLQFYKFMKCNLDKIEPFNVGHKKLQARKRALDLARMESFKGSEYGDPDEDEEDDDEECLVLERVSDYIND